jgi:hypothetical protein
MVNAVFERLPCDRAKRYLELAEQAEERATKADASVSFHNRRGLANQSIKPLIAAQGG